MNSILHYIQSLLHFNPTDRVWQFPFFAGFSVGLVLLVSLLFERIDLGLVGIIGAMSFVYTPNTPIYHRMAVVMCCSFGITLSFSLGVLTHFFHFSIPLVVGIVALFSSILVRYYDLGVPGYFFFVLACIIGTFLPFPPRDFISLVGVVALGTMAGNLAALLYSLSVVYLFKNNPPHPVPVRGHLGFDKVVVDSLIMGTFVGLSMFIGQILGLERSYWVAVSCTVIMQGITLNSIWIKQGQRILGTFIGMFLAFYLVNLNLSGFAFILLMMLLIFLGEFTVVRNYALAMVFFTPYATYLAEASSLLNNPDVIIKARMIDVVVGSILGLLGGAVVHNQRLRVYFRRIARKVFRVNPNDGGV
ncbi:FUSC family protein, partial [Helicobacter sp. MIT 14-3879]|uniref:FUSC family protein n=1 Tax=Helicobacter sp. MIT 14-3879 TaxID=2040649 RepID=UPI000E3A98EA